MGCVRTEGGQFDASKQKTKRPTHLAPVSFVFRSLLCSIVLVKPFGTYLSSNLSDGGSVVRLDESGEADDDRRKDGGGGRRSGRNEGVEGFVEGLEEADRIRESASLSTLGRTVVEGVRSSFPLP